MKTINITFEDNHFKRFNDVKKKLSKQMGNINISQRDLIMFLVAKQEMKFDEVKGGKKDGKNRNN